MREGQGSQINGKTKVTIKGMWHLDQLLDKNSLTSINMQD